jgi:hypothetical protein
MLVAVVVVAMAGCARAAGPGQPAGTTPSQPGSATANEWYLRYVLLARYPDFAYCDPDYYPVQRDDEQPAADDWWARADHSSPEVATILAQRGYHEPLRPDQRLAAYRDHKRLSVITMKAITGGYQFELSTSISGGEPDQTVLGMITPDGATKEGSRQPRPGGCPICLDAEAHIATPNGDVPVALIRPGDVVWTTDSSGRRIAAAVVKTVRRDTPGPHLMLRLALSDGRALIAAGAHPAVDGSYLRQLRAGQPYDGATVTSVGWTLSTAPATFDIRPAGPTGNYWANGIVVGSTLTP